MDIYEKDNRGRTALHWACYYGAENAALFCIAWGYNINDLDNEILMTPLLLAVNCGSLKIT